MQDYFFPAFVLEGAQPPTESLMCFMLVCEHRNTPDSYQIDFQNTTVSNRRRPLHGLGPNRKKGAVAIAIDVAMQLFH